MRTVVRQSSLHYYTCASKVVSQLLWVVFYMFSVAATGSWINPSIIGSLLLILLFQVKTFLSCCPSTWLNSSLLRAQHCCLRESVVADTQPISNTRRRFQGVYSFQNFYEIIVQSFIFSSTSLLHSHWQSFFSRFLGNFWRLTLTYPAVQLEDKRN